MTQPLVAPCQICLGERLALRSLQSVRLPCALPLACNAADCNAAQTQALSVLVSGCLWGCYIVLPSLRMTLSQGKSYLLSGWFWGARAILRCLGSSRHIPVSGGAKAEE